MMMPLLVQALILTFGVVNKVYMVIGSEFTSRMALSYSFAARELLQALSFHPHYPTATIRNFTMDSLSIALSLTEKEAQAR